MILIIILSLLWVLISGYFSYIPLIPGVLSLFLILFLFIKAKKSANYNFKFDLHPFNFILYIPYLIKEIILSNIHVAKDILTNTVSPTLVTCKNDFNSKSCVTLFCNSVNLTPGSFVLNANHERILIHVIDKYTEKGMLGQELENKVKHLKVKPKAQ